MLKRHKKWLAIIAVLLLAGWQVVSRTLLTRHQVVRQNAIALRPAAGQAPAQTGGEMSGIADEVRRQKRPDSIQIVDQAFLDQNKSLVRGLSNIFQQYVVKSRKKFNLSNSDIKRIALILATARLSQLLFEASVADVQKISDDHVLLTIQPYDVNPLIGYVKSRISTVNGNFANSDDLPGLMDGSFDEMAPATHVIDIESLDPTVSGGVDYTLVHSLTRPGEDHPYSVSESYLSSKQLGPEGVFIAPFMTQRK